VTRSAGDHDHPRAARLSGATALLSATTAALLAASCSGGGGSSEAPRLTPNADLDWRDQVIYQALTDRFADGDVNNNQRVDRTAFAKYQGGDWKGIQDQAAYLRDLGVTAVWVSPVVKNVEEDAGVAGYHGYWTQDFLSCNPHFGDMRALRNMVDGLHDSGIYTIVDIVTNHVGQLFFYDINLNGTPEETMYGSGSSPGSPVTRVTEYDPDWDSRGIQAQVGWQNMGPAPVVWLNQPSIFRVAPQPPEFQNPDWYHRKGRVVPDLSGNWPADQVLLGDFPGGLKDVNTEHPDVRRAMVRVFGEWVKRVDIDGFRIDTLKHVEHDFWREFCPGIRQIAASRGKQNFFQFGEAYDGDDGLVGSYTQANMVDSAFYFPQKYVAFDGVIKFNAPTKNIEDLWGRKSFYGQSPQPGGVGVAPARIPVNFIDNHDVPRYLYGQSDDRRLRLSLALLFAIEGVPCLYYGTEQGFAGGGDPANRERLWDSGYDRGHPLFQWTRRLAGLRRDHVSLRRGDTLVRWSTTRTGGEQDAGIFAFERRHPQETVLFVMNANPQKASETSFQGGVMSTSFPAGTRLQDLLDAGFSATVGQGGALVVSVPSLSARILVVR
jgi:glycosidase